MSRRKRTYSDARQRQERRSAPPAGRRPSARATRGRRSATGCGPRGDGAQAGAASARSRPARSGRSPGARRGALHAAPGGPSPAAPTSAASRPRPADAELDQRPRPVGHASQVGDAAALVELAGRGVDERLAERRRHRAGEKHEAEVEDGRGRCDAPGRPSSPGALDHGLGRPAQRPVHLRLQRGRRRRRPTDSPGRPHTQVMPLGSTMRWPIWPALPRRPPSSRPLLTTPASTASAAAAPSRRGRRGPRRSSARRSPAPATTWRGPSAGRVSSCDAIPQLEAARGRACAAGHRAGLPIDRALARDPARAQAAGVIRAGRHHAAHEALAAPARHRAGAWRPGRGPTPRPRSFTTPAARRSWPTSIAR